MFNFHSSFRRVRQRVKRCYQGIADNVVRRACEFCRIVTPLHFQVPRFRRHIFRGKWDSVQQGSASLLPPIDGPYYSWGIDLVSCLRFKISGF